jgi:3-phosphoshikimate 1-carboxyvinyltransferase
MIDEVPAWAIAAARAEGVSRLEGAGELRVKESDRLAALASNLQAVGVEAAERGDGLEIRGGSVRGGAVSSRGDHRIAMAFAALGTLAREPVSVDDVRSIDTSYPGFLDTLAHLTSRS